VIGANGQLGSDLVKELRGYEVVAWTRDDFDLRDYRTAAEAIRSVEAQAVINTAAFHNTEACEDDPESAFAINALAVLNLARASRSAGSAFVHISTDYVFDGDKGTAYTEDDWPNPINVYGVSKRAGEHLVANTCTAYYIIRVASLFGLGGTRSKSGNFVERVVSKATRGEVLKVVNDVTMSPTYVPDAARRIRLILEAKAPFGVYHVTNSGVCTWHAFAAEILRQAEVSAPLQPVASSTMSPHVRRPKNSSLASSRLPLIGLEPLRPWQQALTAYLEVREAEVPA
jgi:dTDP-4-dehydrorhamnose reductase